jgi:Fur family ferric uptake transcriptional regulator
MPTHHDLEAALKHLGYRLTPQRSLILSAVQARDDHFRAEDIHAAVVRQYPHVNLSTVYRTLELLASLGLVTSTDLGGGCMRYHPAPKGRHHHLICQTCGQVQELEESVLQPLADKLLAEYGFRASLGHLAIFGCCAACQR